MLLLALVPLIAYVVIRAAGASTESVRGVALPAWLFTLAAWGAFEAGKSGNARAVIVGLASLGLGIFTIVVPTADPLIGLAAAALMFLMLHVVKPRPASHLPSR